MRTTISLDDDLLRTAKQRALEAHSTLSRLVENALRVALSAPKTRGDASVVPRLRTFRGQGLRPGVDIDHSAALLDMMEER